MSRYTMIEPRLTDLKNYCKEGHEASNSVGADTGNDNSDVNNSSTNSFFCDEVVEKGGTHTMKDTIESRFDVLLKERGWAWAHAYNKLGWDKSYASIVRRGITIPPLWLRIKVAKVFDIDSTVIWRAEDIISMERWEIEK